MKFALNTQQERRRVFHALDAARGIAALVVVLHHLPVTFRGSNFESGYLAVDFFFILSGFVIAHAYFDRLTSGRMGWKEFMKARLVRLYPFYALSLLTMLALLAAMKIAGFSIPWSTTALVGKLPFAILMLPSPALDWHAYLFPFNIAAWSIFFELGVNLLFAVICRSISRPNVRWLLITVSGAIFAAQIIFQDLFGGIAWNTLVAGVPRVCFSFFVGIQIHEWFKHRHTAKPIHSAWSLLTLGVLLVVISAPDQQWLKLTTIFLIFPLSILILAASDVPAGLMGAALRKLGILSYAIYMMHGPILFGWLALYLTPDVRDTKSALVVVPLVLAIIAISWAADRWVDTPLRARLTKRLLKRKGFDESAIQP